MLPCFSNDPRGATALHVAERGELTAWMERHPTHAAWLAACGYRADPGSFVVLPPTADIPMGVLASPAEGESTWSLGSLPLALPDGCYALEEKKPRTSATLGWALGAYQFDRYKAPRRRPASLVWCDDTQRDEVEHVAQAIYLARDLINTPAEDLGPEQLTDVARAIAEQHGAAIDVLVGDALLERGYPAVHLVGRSSPRPPALIDLRWGDPDAPKLTLVGKGVCFDTGGLDIKSHDGMFEMKKDMGGAAVVLGLAQALMATRTPVRLRVLVPAVDNAISGLAMRPRDIVRTRAGKTVEIGFTDAEGRLVLCDALTEACTEQPDLVIDVATLTGSAKAALGSELQAVFSNDDELAQDLVRIGFEVGDPLWRLPIWRPYRRRIDSAMADMSNVAKGLFADAIVATLFLSEFVPLSQRWAHMDIMAMNSLARPGRPEGGEATGLLTLYTYLRRRYGVTNQ